MIINLESLKNFFVNHHFKTVTKEVSPILQYLEVTYRSFVGNKYKVQINLLPSSFIAGIYDSSNHFAVLQMGYNFSHKPKRTHLKETLKLIAHLNGTCLLPGFAYDPSNRKTFYRVSIPIPAHRHLSADMLIGLFHTFIQQIQTFEGLIHSVSEGDVSYEELVKKSQENLIQDVENRFSLAIEQKAA